MASNLDGTFSKIYLAGRFDTANISGATTYKNMVRLNVSGTPTYTIDSGFTTAGTLIDSSNVIINSIIIINKILYVAGTDGTNCIFYRYNGSTWTNLLSASFTGTINVIKAIGATQIAVGGNFTTIGAATTCNNVAIYTISTGVFRSLGPGATKGVTGVASVSPIYAVPNVFALAFINNLLWVGGYFVNAGGTLSNSIAIFNVSGNTWSTVTRGGSATVGLLKETSSTDPGVVYALNISANDTSVIMVGGSFITSTSIISPSKTSQNIFNLVKITVATPNSSITTRSYSNFNSLSTTPLSKS
jgi:hypothetical protein